MSCIWKIHRVDIDTNKNQYKMTYKCGCSKDFITYTLHLSSGMTRIKNYDGVLHINGRMAYCPYCDMPVRVESLPMYANNDNIQEQEGEVPIGK